MEQPMTLEGRSLDSIRAEGLRLRQRKRATSAVGRVGLYIVLTAFALAFSFPFFLTIMSSLKPLSLFQTSAIIPEEFAWKNYYLAVTLVPFARYTLNSLIIVAIVVFCGVVPNLIQGYAFARLRAPGKSVVFTIVLSTMMIPSIVTGIPLYILYNKLGIMDTYLIYLIGGFGGSAFNIFLFRQFFAAMPKELEEAAKIDGCSVMGTLFRIFVPSALPVTIIVAVAAFNAGWGDFMTPWMYFSEDKYPLAMILFNGVSYRLPGAPEGMTYPSLVACAAIMMSIPAIIGFFISQKHIVQGIVTTGLKG